MIPPQLINFIKVFRSARSNIQEKAKSSRSRGSLGTVLSKNTADSVITVIRDKIRQWISEEDMFALEIYFTRDLSTQDQWSVVVVVRCVDSTDTIQERLVGAVKYRESTCEAFVNLFRGYVKSES